jgi:hypothetical protein
LLIYSHGGAGEQTHSAIACFRDIVRLHSRWVNRLFFNMAVIRMTT